MKMKFFLAALMFSAAAATAQTAYDGSSSAFQLSLAPDVALYPRTTDIRGLSLSIWGENPLHGVALGVVNGSTDDSAGFTWGIVNYSETYTGVSWAWVNVNQTKFVGWQDGIVNVSLGDFTGLQSGWIFNYANNFRGLQLGLINYAQNLSGVQIGLANIAANNPWFTDFPDKLATGFPIVNWSF